MPAAPHPRTRALSHLTHSQNLHSIATAKGIPAVLAPLNDFDKVDFVSSPLAVIVCSTTGNGDPPSNAELFWRFIRKRTHPKNMCAGVRYAVLGLGDTNYDKFCAAAKTIVKRLGELEAKPFYDSAFADEAIGLEGVVDPWAGGLWDVLVAALAVQQGEDAGESIAASAAVVPPVVVAVPPAAGPPPPIIVAGPSTAPAGGEVAALLSPMARMHELQSLQEEQRHHLEGERRRARLSSLGAADVGALAAGAAAVPVEVAGAVLHLHPSVSGAGIDLDTRGRSVDEVLEAAAQAAAIVVADEARLAAEPHTHGTAHVALQPVPCLPTPGVQSLWALVPTLLRAGAAVRPGSVPLPPAAQSFSSKIYPPSPPITVDVRLIGGGEVVAAEGGHASPCTFTGRDLESPLLLPIQGARYLTRGGRESDRRVVHLDVAVGNTPLGGASGWSPGDALGVLAPNIGDQVATLAARLGVPLHARCDVSAVGAAARSGTACLPIYLPPWLPGYPCPRVEDLLTWCVDLTTPPKRAAVRLLAEACPPGSEDGDALAWLAGREGKVAYGLVVEDQRLTLLDVLALFPSSLPSLAALLSALPPLSPRFYSLACSPLAHPGTMSVAYTVVQYEVAPAVGPLPSSPTNEEGAAVPAQRVTRHGLATTWLEGLCAPWLSGGGNPPSPVFLRAFLRPTRDFLPPASPSTPLIMIGPGTGVAPFIGFLQHREAKAVAHERAAVAPFLGTWRGVRLRGLREDRETLPPLGLGPSILFFGNRRENVDYLYREELGALVANGTLSALHTAWSRAGGAKVYVQHKLREWNTGRAVAELILRRGAHVYVCGDGGGMARDVHAALSELLTEHAAEFGGLPTLSSPPVGKAVGGVTVPLTPPRGGGGASAAEFLGDLAKRGRYVRDIWS